MYNLIHKGGGDSEGDGQKCLCGYACFLQEAICPERSSRVLRQRLKIKMFFVTGGK